jgi:hypothetical protein
MNADHTLCWMRHLYDRCKLGDGHIVIVAANKSKSCTWRSVASIPCRHIEQAAQVATSLPDLYVKVNLMDADAMAQRLAEKRLTNPRAQITGNRDEVKTVVSFHLDVDANKPGYLDRETTLALLDKMPKPPTMVVNSKGSVGGFHAYWCLREPFRIQTPADREYISKLTLRWQRRLDELTGGKLDSTANIDRVLRTVGSQRSSGEFVSLQYDRPDAIYSLRDLALPPSGDEIRSEAQRVVTKQINEILGPCKSTGQPISDYIRAASVTVEALLEAHGYQRLRDDEWIRPNSESGSRSLKIATKLGTPGINVFSGSDPHFPCLQRDQRVGRFYSLEEMFVRLRHGGDWKAAARWCAEKISLPAMKRPAREVHCHG